MVVLATDILSAFSPIGYSGSRGFTGSASTVQGFTGSAGFTGSLGFTGSAATVTTSTTPPAGAVDGNLWFDEDDGAVYIYYNDGTSAQWVEIGNSNYIPTAAGANTQVQYNTNGTLAASSNFTYNGTNLTVASGNIIDSKGDVRDIPINDQSGATYTLAASDTGKFVSITNSTITVPNATFVAGDVITIYNDGANGVNINQGASTTMYWSGTTGTTGNRFLDSYSVVTILCVAANTFVISGSGLT